MTHFHTSDNAQFFLAKLQSLVPVKYCLGDDYDQNKYFIYKTIQLLVYANTVTVLSFLFPFLLFKAVDDIRILVSLAKGEGGTSVVPPRALFLQLTELSHYMYFLGQSALRCRLTVHLFPFRSLFVHVILWGLKL